MIDTLPDTSSAPHQTRSWDRVRARTVLEDGAVGQVDPAALVRDDDDRPAQRDVAPEPHVARHRQVVQLEHVRHRAEPARGESATATARRTRGSERARMATSEDGEGRGGRGGAGWARKAGRRRERDRGEGEAKASRPARMVGNDDRRVGRAEAGWARKGRAIESGGEHRLTRWNDVHTQRHRDRAQSGARTEGEDGALWLHEQRHRGRSRRADTGGEEGRLKGTGGGRAAKRG